MTFDIEMIKAVSERTLSRMETVKKGIDQPLTLAEENLDINSVQASLTLNHFSNEYL